MRKLEFSVNYNKLIEKKEALVPTIFTEYQFKLVLKKLKGATLLENEKVYFSKSISKKLRSLDMIKEEFQIYGGEDIIFERVQKSKKILNNLKRKFKNKMLIISGSYLYSNKYNDIDVFVISKYEKQDFSDGELSINYVKKDFLKSLMFQSIKKCCISTHELNHNINEKVDISDLIRSYEQLLLDIKNKYPKKESIKTFLLISHFLKTSSSLSSKELYEEYQRLKNKKPLIFNKLFVCTLLESINKKAKNFLEKQISYYRELTLEYPKQKDFYNMIIEPLTEVIKIGY